MVPTPILTTKLFAPPVRGDLVIRSHLIEQIDEGINGKLTLIAAPPGFGKTTLVSEWCQQSQLPSTWLSLDEVDNDPARFMAYLVATLQQLDANLGKDMESLLQLQLLPSSETLMTLLLNDVAAIPQRFVLILDDYHIIESQPIHDLMAFLLNHLPTTLHLMLVTRTDPPFPLGRLRARGEMNELRSAALRFSEKEAANFLNDVAGLSLSDENISSLEARTEGWIAGLQLAALSLKNQEDMDGFIRNFAGNDRHIEDYLVEEVLQRQDESTQSFLLKTSVLGRMTGSLCDATLGIDDGQSTLIALEQANLFIVPLDNKRRWYRYHHLFADLLQRQLRREQPHRIQTYHQRAAAWFEQNDLIPEAMKHALTAGDVDHAIGLIERNAQSLMKNGEFTTLRRWLDQEDLDAATRWAQERNYLTQLSVPSSNADRLPVSRSNHRLRSHLPQPISKRELDVLLNLERGLSNKEIARKLFLSLSTVKSHTYNVYRKLGVNSRTQAVVKAKTLGLL